MGLVITVPQSCSNREGSQNQADCVHIKNSEDGFWGFQLSKTPIELISSTKT